MDENRVIYDSRTGESVRAFVSLYPEGTIQSCGGSLIVFSESGRYIYNRENSTVTVETSFRYHSFPTGEHKEGTKNRTTGIDEFCEEYGPVKNNRVYSVLEAQRKSIHDMIREEFGI